jgi:DNA-directed RNA polymerase III subunit RPC6
MSPPREYEEHSLYSNKQLKKLDQDLMMQAMQRLLKSSRLKLVMHPKVGQCMVYVSEAQAKLEIEKFGGLSHNEILVFQKIEESGVKGLFQRDLKSRTGITNPNTIRTIIDKLMRRKLIKDFTSVHTGKKKMYILAELEPSKELTGGNWYTNGDLDLDLVEVCTKLALKFFEQREKAAREKGTTDHGGSVQEVGDFIKGKGVVSCELTMEEVLQLVSTLEYDGLIESLLKDASMLRPADRTFRLVRQGLAGAFEHFTSLPTSICPVANISFPSQPSLCPLLDYWLRL